MRWKLRGSRGVLLIVVVMSLFPLAWTAYGQLAGVSGAAGAVAETETSFWGQIFSSDYMPRQTCMNGDWDLIRTHVISDIIIAAAYYSIPVALVYFVRKRKDIVFGPIFYLFAIFILACGTTHVFSVIAIWRPYYWLDGIIKALTAGVSILTAVLLWPLIPKALKIPSPRQLQMANAQLQGEIAERVKAETELRVLTTGLEARVRERTIELEQANEQLREEIRVRKGVEAGQARLMSSERAARSDAERASRAKDEFLATLSHELRTPVTAILGWTQLLRANKGVSADDVTQGLEIIERNSRVQVGLIEDMLDMSRVIAGKLRLEVKEVDLAAVLQAAVETVSPAAAAKEIQILIARSLDGRAGMVMGDPNRLQQVVWNLLSNAVKFTPKGGRVEVELRNTDSRVEIVVSDTGQGIKPDFLPYVFDRFRQEDSSSSRRHGGLGLGLAIVRHLVELHGGSVRVTSAGEGMGAAFVMSLPRAAVQGHRAEKRQESVGQGSMTTEMPSLAGVSVLVVDDEADSREVVRRVLTERGATVIVAGSAKEAMERIKEMRPMVLVSDIGMPEEDGYGLIKRVRELGILEGGMTPAVALTAFAREEDRRRIMLSGFQMHLSKPSEAGDLVRAVARLAGLMFRQGVE